MFTINIHKVIFIQSPHYANKFSDSKEYNYYIISFTYWICIMNESTQNRFVFINIVYISNTQMWERWLLETGEDNALKMSQICDKNCTECSHQFTWIVVAWLNLYCKYFYLFLYKNMNETLLEVKSKIEINEYMISQKNNHYLWTSYRKHLNENFYANFTPKEILCCIVFKKIALNT